MSCNSLVLIMDPSSSSTGYLEVRGTHSPSQAGQGCGPNRSIRFGMSKEEILHFLFSLQSSFPCTISALHLLPLPPSSAPFLPRPSRAQIPVLRYTAVKGGWVNGKASTLFKSMLAFMLGMAVSTLSSIATVRDSLTPSQKDAEFHPPPQAKTLGRL